MTVAELITRLEVLPPDATVFILDPRDSFPDAKEIENAQLWEDLFDPGVYLL